MKKILTPKDQRRDISIDLPHNFDAEEGILASILIDVSNEVINNCLSLKVNSDYFFDPRHRSIFEACVALFNEGRGIDGIVLADFLNKRNLLEQAGGVTEINRIAGRIETYAHYKQWIEIVREKYFLRELVKECSSTIEKVYESHFGDLGVFLGDVEERVLRISQDRVGDTVKKASDHVDSALAKINDLIVNKGELSGVPTGFKGLDNMMRGLHPNEMIVIAARPGIGKTSIALNITESALFGKNPTPTLIFSLEMMADDLYKRIISSRARVDQYKLSMGRISPEQLKDIVTTANELKEVPLWIDDTSGLSILEMRAKARRLNQQLGGKLGLVIVDYLQLLHGSGLSMSREQDVAEISRGMKAMSKELLAPVVVLAQLNRESEKGDRDPRSSDLRESGSIEQDADAVILLSKKREYEQNWIIKVILAKQRNGPTGEIDLLFNRSYTRYENFIDENDVKV